MKSKEKYVTIYINKKINILRRGNMSFYIDKFIKEALEEDMGIIGDITTDSLFEDNHISKGIFNFRKAGVVAGVEFAKRVFELLDGDVKFVKIKSDGEFVQAGENIAIVEGSTKAILKGERTALNIMQRLSGIATNTRKYAEKLEGYDCMVADTRKTTPLFRYFEKYAVKTGGGKNHRFGLFDAVMLKDNHIAAAGGIKAAVKKVRKNIPHTMKIEVEAESKEQAIEAMNAGADIIMLDNMRGEKLAECVKILKGKVITEASGNITVENIEEVAKTGVDIISTGALIYSAGIIDIGLDFE